MNAETMVAVAVHSAESRDESLEVAAALCAFATIADIAGDCQLRDRLVARASECLEDG